MQYVIRESICPVSSVPTSIDCSPATD
jgi:hypothetical protein